MARELEIQQGLRDPSGALRFTLVAEEYVQGMEDFETGTSPPKVTSDSYDLGRMRAAEKKEAASSLIAEMEKRRLETNQRVRKLLADRPDLLAEYDARMAEIRP